MSRWTEEDDATLLEYADAIGAERVGTHNLGRSAEASLKRYNHLLKSGAAVYYAQSRASKLAYILRAGLRVKGSEAEFFVAMQYDEWKYREILWAEKSLKMSREGGAE